MKKRVLVTGGSGYIGSAIKEKLEAESWVVHLAGRSNESVLIMDFDDPSSIGACSVDQGVYDLCIHVAAANEVDCINDPQKSMGINVLGTSELISWCINAKIPRFIYISTFHVFGGNTGSLIENTKPQPLNLYGVSHYLAEEVVAMHDRCGDIEGATIRLPNVIGAPRNWPTFNRWTLAPFDFCRQAHNTHAIRLMSSGVQKRNWLDINAFADSLLEIALMDQIPKLIHLPGTDMSILELANGVADSWRSIFGQTIEVQVPNENMDATVDPVRLFESLYNVQVRVPDVPAFVTSVGQYIATYNKLN
mgnify:CR=1 FL=1|tara:strand:+ start:359 stop:1276 length:918 start_codon:yes stop_codon:yes gene_type:complete